MRVYTSHSRDPFFHLAVEEWLLRECEGEAWFFYRNDPCVVVGRFQNPWKECDLGWMRTEGIPLVRRPSGGGTVWHDAGNVNFCHVGPLQGFTRKRALEVVRAKLAQLGVEVEINARYDLVVPQSDGTTRKVSGSAYKQTKNRALHHGTLLIHGDLDRLGRSLASPNQLHSTKSIPSVRSRVTNLSQLTPETWISSWGPGQVLSPTDDRFHPEHWSRWEWVFGETPHFEWKFRVDQHPIELSSHKGMIREFRWGQLGIVTHDLDAPLCFASFQELARENQLELNSENWLRLLGT